MHVYFGKKNEEKKKKKNNIAPPSQTTFPIKIDFCFDLG